MKLLFSSLPERPIFSRLSLKRKNPIFSVILGGCLFLSIGMLGGCHKKPHENKEQFQEEHQPQTSNINSNGTYHLADNSPTLSFIQVDTVHEEPLPAVSDLPATFAYDELKTVRYFSPINGRITSINVRPGDQVTKGQTLATIDSPDFGTAISDNDSANQEVRFRQQAYDRSRMLYEGGAIPKRDLDAAYNDYQQAKIAQQKANRNLSNLTQGSNASSGSKQSLKAPISGTVAEMNINPGQQIRSDSDKPLFTISDLSELWIDSSIEDKDSTLVQKGNKVQINIPVLDNLRLPATITQVNTVLDATSHRLGFHAKLDKPDSRVRAQMLGQMDLFSNNAPDSFPIPNGAIVTEGLNTYVIRDTGNNNFQRQQVKVGHQDANTTYVTSGLKEGDQIVTKGALLLSTQMSGAE